MDDSIPLFPGDGRECVVTRDARVAHHAVIRTVFFYIIQQYRLRLFSIGDIKLQAAHIAPHSNNFVPHCV